MDYIELGHKKGVRRHSEADGPIINLPIKVHQARPIHDIYWGYRSYKRRPSTLVMHPWCGPCQSRYSTPYRTSQKRTLGIIGCLITVKVAMHPWCAPFEATSMREAP
jgi:hypothetical protein